MNLYEKNPTDLQSQIEHYQLLRKENATLYYARKEGYDRLGLQHVPPLRVSENHAKTAIKMNLILQSLAKSSYANEPWTLADTSADLFNSPPRNCFKKESYEVEVWFDNDKKNAFPYINWNFIYYQDENDMWHKVKGEADYNGLYFTEVNGTRNYFLLFDKDSSRYGNTGIWTVNYKNVQILPPSVTSSSRKSVYDSQDGEPSIITAPEKENRRGTPQQEEAGPSSTTQSPKPGRRRRRGEQRESPTRKRRRGAQDDGDSDFVTVGEVGKSHRSVPRTGLNRIERLKEEARDPPVILLKGGANKLKCWRNRYKAKVPNFKCTTVFKWVGDESLAAESRILVAFDTIHQRDQFIASAQLPKGTVMSLGSLDSL